MNILLPLIFTSLAATLLEFLLPGDRSSKMARPLHAIAGLCVLVALIGPLRQGILLLRGFADGGIDDLTDRLESTYPGISDSLSGADGYMDELTQYLASAGADAVEAWVREALYSQFGIPGDQCVIKAVVRLTVSPTPSDPAQSSGSGQTTAGIEGVWITLIGSSVFKNPHIIEEWFSQRLACPCTVSVG